MEIALYVIIFILLAVILVLLFRPRKVELPAIDELEACLLYTSPSPRDRS